MSQRVCGGCHENFAYRPGRGRDRCSRHGHAACALIGSAIARPGYYGYGYGPGPYYAAGPAYGYGPPCVWRRQRVWDGYGWIIRRVRVCY